MPQYSKLFQQKATWTTRVPDLYNAAEPLCHSLVEGLDVGFSQVLDRVVLALL